VHNGAGLIGCTVQTRRRIQHSTAVRSLPMILDGRRMIVLYCKSTAAIASQVFWRETVNGSVNLNLKLPHYSTP
jgi:hypothetical protein